jgi:hypothetical protein
MADRSETQDQAHRYAEHGWPCFPCVPGEKAPATAHGVLDATTDHGQIERWFARNPERNVAIATGAPGPDVLDIDKHGDQSGFPALRQLKEAGLVGEPQAMVRTPSGGAHLYFKGSEHQRNGHIDAKHVDFRSNGGYVVAPPSRVNGRPYEVVSHQASTETLDWGKAKELLDPQPERRREWQPRADASQQDLSHLTRLVADKGEGGRNEALFWSACRAAEVGRTDVFPDLAAAAASAGLPQREIDRTLASAERTAGGREQPARPFEREAAG